MDFTKLPKLITSDESQELFECQNDILLNQNLSDNEKLIKLAIIQTLSPVEDWERASGLLKKHICSFDTFHLLIGVYIALIAFEFTRYKDIGYFISLIDEQISTIEGDYLSIAYFIKAKYILEKGGDKSEAIVLLKKSVFYGTKFVMNYLELAKYMDDEAQKFCLRKACANVQSVYGKNSINNISILDLIDPLNFFNEKITRVDINEYDYQYLVCLSQ